MTRVTARIFQARLGKKRDKKNNKKQKKQKKNKRKNGKRRNRKGKTKRRKGREGRKCYVCCEEIRLVLGRVREPSWLDVSRRTTAVRRLPFLVFRVPCCPVDSLPRPRRTGAREDLGYPEDSRGGRYPGARDRAQAYVGHSWFGGRRVAGESALGRSDFPRRQWSAGWVGYSRPNGNKINPEIFYFRFSMQSIKDLFCFNLDGGVSYN